MVSSRQGTCTTFKRCYPYFKTFALQPEESWIMGSYDTCSHHTADGRHVMTQTKAVTL